MTKSAIWWSCQTNAIRKYNSNVHLMKVMAELGRTIICAIMFSNHFFRIVAKRLVEFRTADCLKHVLFRYSAVTIYIFFPVFKRPYLPYLNVILTKTIVVRKMKPLPLDLMALMVSEHSLCSLLMQIVRTQIQLIFYKKTYFSNIFAQCTI